VPICIVGDLFDLTNQYFAKVALQNGHEVLELDEGNMGVIWSFEYSDAQPSQGRLIIGENEYSFMDLRGVFVRLNPAPKLPSVLGHLRQEEQGVLVVERRHSLLHLLNHIPCTVVNRSKAGRSNGSKPYQMRYLESEGFTVPRWIMSNDADFAKTFTQSCHNGAVYKSCSGLRSRVRIVDDRLFERLKAGSTPVIIQERIFGYNVRVHVVSGTLFAAKVVSEEIDYRFDTGAGDICATTVPTYLHALCQRVTEQEGLVLSGFDFMVTAEGTWYCLEVNPVPTFLPYEVATGHPISKTILSLFQL